MWNFETYGAGFGGESCAGFHFRVVFDVSFVIRSVDYAIFVGQNVRSHRG